jgi:hypothetical protein
VRYVTGTRTPLLRTHIQALAAPSADIATHACTRLPDAEANGHGTVLFSDNAVATIRDRAQAEPSNQ